MSQIDVAKMEANFFKTNLDHDDDRRSRAAKFRNREFEHLKELARLTLEMLRGFLVQRLDEFNSIGDSQEEEEQVVCSTIESNWIGSDH